MEDVRRLLNEESRVLEQHKEKTRIVARARGLTEAEINDPLPRHTAGSKAIYYRQCAQIRAKM